MWELKKKLPNTSSIMIPFGYELILDYYISNVESF